ncbi:hypothetical protein AB0K86_17525 [Streptomyces clavifer]|uniref:hypothetical protein n=1 Tax=Streptomyces TaxID=1883 RepID=UPI0006F6B812|nr:hypothetical protein [Streptomyces sp. Root55]KQZ19974.1 hypothetical protein ASD51_27230 [Streptomyces sp. Root55]
MSENTSTSTISADYAQRITDDLAANRSEQDRARAELTRLQDALVQLETGEQILVKMQEVLGGGSTKPAVRKSKDRKVAAVPAARSPKSRTASPKGGRKQKAQADQGAPADGGAATKVAGDPTWRELVTGYLTTQREPKSAAEVTSALAESHPQRKTQVAVVRNTLEQGVAHGLLERSKQGRSVYYSPVSATTSDA